MLAERRPEPSEGAPPPAGARGRAARVVRRAGPWALAAAVLGLLAWRVSLPALARNLGAGPIAPLGLYCALTTALTLLLDGWATRRALAVCGLPRPLGEVVAVRGGSYLLGLINYAVGQGALGWYAYRLGVPRARALGIVAFLLSVNLWALVAVAAAGLTLYGAPLGVEPPWLPVALIAAGAAAYLAALSIPWPWLRRQPLLEPLLAAGVGGHLAAAGPRTVHVLGLVLAVWGGLRIWGVAVPAGVGIAAMPLVLLAAALPVTPGGLGLTQGSMVLLFRGYAGGSAAEGEAAVLAFGLAWSALGYLSQALLGGWCLWRLRRRGLAPGPP